ncbi:hypothetical protein N8Z24_00260, partial [bacterium]|nr:hypothetical protein [bacterium]
FERDSIVRNAGGKPFGRVVLPEDFEYSEGIDSLPVLILKIPKVLCESPFAETFYIDGYKYTIPRDVPSFRLNLRGQDWIVASFYLRRVPSEETP